MASSSGDEVPVTITYAHPGTHPPIYLAGSFSDPAWQPQEMHVTKDERGEHYFSKDIKLQPGKAYQYKFRIGEGDWWVLDETAPVGMLGLFCLSGAFASSIVAWTSSQIS
jgi:hypothetical protein